ncbi:MAG: sulfatase [bacterium]|nr:sulfatase [bacterium]
MKYYAHLFCVLLLGLSACSERSGNKQEPAELNGSVDFLQQFHSQQQQETNSIDFRSAADPGKYLLHGWGDPEKKFTWALKDRSSLLFYRYDTMNDVELEILGTAFPAIDNTPQIIEVFVNDLKLSTFTMNVSEVRKYPLTVPAKMLRSGSNVLEFRFSYSTKPRELNPKSTGSRRLSAAFYQITFSKSGNLMYSREATQEIDFRQGASSQQLLISGWDNAESERRWATSTTSRVGFYAYGKKALKLRMVCDTLPSHNGEKQVVTVLLNDTPAGTFTVKPGVFKTYTVKLPAGALRVGANLLEFRSAYSSRPSRLFKGSGDNRDLALAFQQIFFKNNPPIEPADQMQIWQDADSNMVLIRELSDLFEFELAYKSSRGARPQLLILRDEQEPIAIELDPGKKTHRETVALPGAGVYKIQLVTKGKAGSFTEWKDFHVSSASFASSAEQEAESQAAMFAKSSKPDIVLYIVDTLRWDHLGCYGYERNTSPHLDRFARENTLFTNAYSTVAWTKPSAATIVSGLLPKNHKTVTKKAKLPEEIVTLSEILQANGYYTVAFTTNGNFGKIFGFSQGFDEFRRFVSRQPITLSEMSDRVNEDLLPFIEEYAAKKDRKPLFLIVWTMDPHDPYTPDESVKEMFDIQQYEPIDTYDLKFLFKIQAGETKPSASQIEYIKTRYDQEIFFNDRSFGEMLNTMKTAGLYDDALILFSSDHGEEFWDHGGTGHGRTLYNEQVKIPFVLKAKQIPAGSNSRLTQHIDIYPTLLDIVGIEAPYRLDGVSLLAPPNPERRIFFEEDFDRSVLTASLDSRKKTIFNRQYHRPGVEGHVPPFEVFHVDDLKEDRNLGISSIEDEFRFNELFSFIAEESSLSLQKTETEIPQELDEHLKELGYVQ